MSYFSGLDVTFQEILNAILEDNKTLKEELFNKLTNDEKNLFWDYYKLKEIKGELYE